jgi:hypothetical protein
MKIYKNSIKKDAITCINSTFDLTCKSGYFLAGVILIYL